MASNRSQGGQSEFVNKAPDGERVSLRDLEPAMKADVCRLLTALMNATVKQLNCQIRSACKLEQADLEIADCVVGIALNYKAHLLLPDALEAAVTTSEDLQQLKTVVTVIENSRRLDAVLGRANELLDSENLTFTRRDQEIWIGRRITRETPYFLSALVTVYDYFDAAPP